MSKSFYKKNDINTLILLAQNNDIKALEELIRRVQRDIYSIFTHLTSKKDDVSDLTQEVLLKMAKSISTLKDVKNFKSWLNRIITNTFYDFSKRKPDHIVELDEDKFNEIRDKLGCEPGDRCLFTELEKLIKLALMTLPKDLRLSLVLREFEGLSYEDIAKATNTTLGTVKSRISRARLKLQEELRDFI
ncbi:MAG: sigma-70 family RNA polymerase sigma factor [Cyanobacteria bacterium SIG28]|nr:sigma-70 family RNA polymerase sigma factor [Cyanobacteria bacterium SIG28]